MNILVIKNVLHTGFYHML